MTSTFTGIEIGKRSILAHSQGMNVVGQNMSNASVEGYSRQRISMQASDPLYYPGMNGSTTPGQIGQGVDIVEIKRVSDMLLTGRIISSTHERGYWNARNNYLLRAENIYHEPSHMSMRSRMDEFWSAWNDLSAFPDQSPQRIAVVSTGKNLIDSINNRYTELKNLRDDADFDLRDTVDQINDYMKNIAALNNEITRVKNGGDNPNDLMDRRDLLAEKLGELIHITIDDKDPDEFNIHMGGYQLVQGDKVALFSKETDVENAGYTKVVWAEQPDVAVDVMGGKLGALIELRDKDLRGEIQKLDTMTINFTDMVNSIHRSAYDAKGETGRDFFVERPYVDNINGNYDSNGDGVFDQSRIFRLSGSNVLDPESQIGISGTLTLSSASGENITIDYNATDTVKDLIDRINHSETEVFARLDFEGRLTLKASASERMENPDFVIRHVEDSGFFLTTYSGILQNSGPEGAFDWQNVDAVAQLSAGNAEFSVAPTNNPSAWLSINEDLVRDPSRVATGFGENGRPSSAKDGEAALAIASIMNDDVALGKSRSFHDYMAETIASIGERGRSAEMIFYTVSENIDQMRATRENLVGVNIDEEITDMLKFQHGYMAASRIISQFDKMLDTVINRMGV
ncbi:MAG: flagellar hook-associated protein FlgK [Spirochaetales bacterium]|nr:flagellar hook-associated protein FlgK [Spirochaetales bacterium]